MKTIKLTKDEPTLLALIAIILAVAALWAIGCGGGGGSYSAPTTPSTTTTPTTPAAVTVNIVGITGSAAFSPNPVPAASGATMAWKNNTSDLHHLVMDDGSAVIGDVAPGATLTMQLKGAGGNYHC